MSKADVARWEEQAKFLRNVGAIHGEWTTYTSNETQLLTKLVLGPIPTPPGARPVGPPPTKGVAAKLLAQHETMFAASRHKPPFTAPAEPDAAVPRAVRAKREAAANGPKKASKRGS